MGGTGEEMVLFGLGLNEKMIPEQRGLCEGVPWTVDSGASEPVANPKHLPECVLSPSPGSLAGQSYVGPGLNERIPNLGQLEAKRMLPNGCVGSVKFQGANVRKPLLAVSSLNDKGNPVWFDHDQTGGSFIIPGSAPELLQIRALIKQVEARVRMDRKGGIFQLRNWTMPPPTLPAAPTADASGSGFPRQTR